MTYLVESVQMWARACIRMQSEVYVQTITVDKVFFVVFVVSLNLAAKLRKKKNLADVFL